MRIASLLGGFISKKSSVFVPACAGQTGDDVRAKRPPAGDGNGGWKQKGKVPKTLDFIGFSALWMAHPEELESTAYCLGGSRSILLSYGCMCGNVHYTVFPRACQAKAHEIGARRTK